MTRHQIGALPREHNEYDPAMITSMAREIQRIADRSGPGGMRISFEWLEDVLDGDEILTRRVLTAAGFSPPTEVEWRRGKGRDQLSDRGYPGLLEDRLTDILDDHTS
ncbi:hypothetical protein FIU85_08755 [Roseovarius sp. THAF8]|uniref:hypothetical protein n=1 Tax=Roseovarius sp. THAF8 TaxID=2587846 RepID=UPI0012683B2B|nr:hypothetical protein [Roseovarius sp. THAF8]QFT97389.1 hypothetical protein FIU85_08755 [Roseovarius sp. THAF8]